MSRDYRKLQVFTLADSLAIAIYRATNDFPPAERFGLQSQMRRSALSVATNIVEGSARRSTREYVNFLNIAAGAAAETRYLADVSTRLGFVSGEDARELNAAYTRLCGQLEALIRALSREVQLPPRT